MNEVPTVRAFLCIHRGQSRKVDPATTVGNTVSLINLKYKTLKSRGPFDTLHKETLEIVTKCTIINRDLQPIPVHREVSLHYIVHALKHLLMLAALGNRCIF